MRPRAPRSAAIALGAALVAVSLAGPAVAQQPAAPAAVLVIDRDAVFAGTARGRALLGALERESEALGAENAEIEAGLRAEERALTERRAAMDPAEFRAAADAFDARVQEIRARQDAKARELLARQDGLGDAFWAEALPILGEILAQRGAGVVLERGAVFLSSDAVDITGQAIAMIDAATLPAEPEPAPPPAAQPPAPE